MSFFDTYVEAPSGHYIGADEKQEMIDAGVTLVITELVDDQENRYGPRWVARVVAPNMETGEDEERLVSFPQGTVESRDRQLQAMSDYLTTDDAEDVAVKLTRVGKSIIIQKAE